MTDALRAELLKLTTTRTWWALALVLTVYVALIGVFLTFADAAARPSTLGQPAPDLDLPVTVASLYAVGVAVAYVFPALLGVLVITTEYRYRTITPTFLAQPHRWPVLLAKLAVATATGAVYGVAALALTVPAVAAVLAATGHPTRLGDAGV